MAQEVIKGPLEAQEDEIRGFGAQSIAKRESKSTKSIFAIFQSKVIHGLPILGGLSKNFSSYHILTLVTRIHRDHNIEVRTLLSLIRAKKSILA